MKTISTALAVALFAVTTAAQAGVSDDFAACDGRMKPKSKDDGMRGVATEKMGFGANRASGYAATIAACDKVLAGEHLLPTQTLRRAHLLRARAAAYIEGAQPAAALADLDAAEQAIAGRRGEVFFDRSMGASLDLLRAMALVQSERSADAQPLVDKAAATRPYALQVQLAAAMLRDSARTPATAAAGPWDGLLRIMPEAAAGLATREVDLGNFAAAVRIADHAPLRMVPRPSVTKSDPIAAALDNSTISLSTASGALDLAFAYAEVKRLKEAREHLELARAGFAAFGSGSTTNAAAGVGAARGLIAKLFEPKIKLTEARIAVAEGRVDEARRLAMGNLPATAATVALFRAIAVADDGAPPAGLAAIEAEVAKKRPLPAATVGKLAETVLVAPETERSVIDYEKSRPDVLKALVGAAFSMGTTLLQGVEKTAGFKETANADGTITVEYLGSTPSAPMVQEMTLLRAAELTKAQGQPRFVVEARHDFTRYLTQSQYGTPLNRTPTGHKTELRIRPVAGDAATAGLAIDATEVIAALGPLYYRK